MSKGHIHKAVKNLIELCKTNPGFTQHMHKVNVLSCDNGVLKAEFTVDEQMTNHYGTLHGAFSSLLLDNLTTYALISHPKAKNGGVSVTMNTEYLKSAQIGQVLQADAVSVKVGRSLAFTEMKLYDKETGNIVVKGTHTKYVGEF